MEKVGLAPCFPVYSTACDINCIAIFVRFDIPRNAQPTMQLHDVLHDMLFFWHAIYIQAGLLVVKNRLRQIAHLSDYHIWNKKIDLFLSVDYVQKDST